MEGGGGGGGEDIATSYAGAGIVQIECQSCASIFGLVLFV